MSELESVVPISDDDISEIEKVMPVVPVVSDEGVANFDLVIRAFIARIKQDAVELARLRNVESCHLARTASLAADEESEPCPQVLVPIPDAVWPGVHKFDSTHPEYGIDAEGRKCLSLDACIVPIVETLWNAGILTLSCCCGHGSGWGVVTVRPSCAPERKP